MVNIVIPFEIEKILRDTIEKDKALIIRYKKPKHKEPSLGDAWAFLIHKREVQIKFCKETAKKIRDCKNIDEIKDMSNQIINLP
jgi:hypothetical protein